MKDIKKTEYKYTYANGEVITITAKALGTETDKWIEILVHMDKTELNNERAETRRHISIDESDPEGVFFASKDCVEQLVEDKELMMMFYKTLDNLVSLVVQDFSYDIERIRLSIDSEKMENTDYS